MTPLLATLASAVPIAGCGAFLHHRARRLDRLPTGGLEVLADMFEEA